MITTLRHLGFAFWCQLLALAGVVLLMLPVEARGYGALLLLAGLAGLFAQWGWASLNRDEPL